MNYPTFIIALFLSINIQAQIPVAMSSTAKGIIVDSKDNLIVRLYNRNSIMKISPEGKVAYITEDITKGIINSPRPNGTIMTIDTRDNIYLTDGNLIWKITPDGQVNLYAGIPYKSTVLDGPLSLAQFRSIELMEIDSKGNIYLAEKDDTNKDNLGDYYLIRKISVNGMVTTLVNTRENADLKTKWISGMGVDSIGNIYISDGNGRCIKKIAANGKITTVAGLCNKREFHPVYAQGDISKAELMSPKDILINKKGEIIFTDSRLHRIIKIANNKVSTIAGNSTIQPNSVNMGGRAMEGYKDGKALTALFNFPLGCDMAIDSKQNIYVIDGGNDCIRKLSTDGVVTTFAKK